MYMQLIFNYCNFTIESQFYKKKYDFLISMEFSRIFIKLMHVFQKVYIPVQRNVTSSIALHFYIYIY